MVKNLYISDFIKDLMIKEIIYLIIILSGIPVGLFLAKICKEEIKSWRKRLKILIVSCIVVIVAVFFLDFEYKISAIVTLSFMIVTCLTIGLKRN